MSATTDTTATSNAFYPALQLHWFKKKSTDNNFTKYHRRAVAAARVTVAWLVVHRIFGKAPLPHPPTQKESTAHYFTISSTSNLIDANNG